MRTAILLGITAAFGVVGYAFFPPGLLLVGLLLSIAGTIVFGVMAGRRPLHAKLPAMAYAAMQGVLIGAICAQYAAKYDGIIVQALLATSAVVGATLLLFASGVIRPGAKARSVIYSLALGAFVFYAVNIVFTLLGSPLPGMDGGGGFWAYAIPVVMLVIASLTLFAGYSIVLEAIQQQADERFEWFAAYGIAASIIWVFIEFIRLFAVSR